MVIGIVGSREYPLLGGVAPFVRAIEEKYPWAIVCSGGARGVDQEAERAAKAAGLSVVSFRPKKITGPGVEYWVVEKHAAFITTVRDADGDEIEFDTFRDAAFARNGWIVDESDIVVAYWDETSRGTKNTIDTARRRSGMRTFVYGATGQRIAEYESAS